MSKLSVIRIPESGVLTPTGEFDARLSGRIAAQFINKSNSELTRKNHLSNLQQFMFFPGNVMRPMCKSKMFWHGALRWRNAISFRIPSRPS